MTSAPTTAQTIKALGTLPMLAPVARNRIAGEANPNREEATDAEPVVIAYVRIDGEDIPRDYRANLQELISGTEVRAKINCGPARAGYSLFYGVWEFLNEKAFQFL